MNEVLYFQHPRTYQGCTQVIGTDRGHLMDGVSRSNKNPWGDFVGTWDLPKQIPGKSKETKWGHQPKSGGACLLFAWRPLLDRMARVKIERELSVVHSLSVASLVKCTCCSPESKKAIFILIRSTSQRPYRSIRQRTTETDVERERGSKSSQRHRQERPETGATIRKYHVG